jgi:ribosomal protein L24E
MKLQKVCSWCDQILPPGEGECSININGEEVISNSMYLNCLAMVKIELNIEYPQYRGGK